MSRLVIDIPPPLSADESLSLALFEGVIRSGKMAMGLALAMIRDNRLYRGTHATFEAYCKDRFNMNRDYANKKIRAAAAVRSLDTNVSSTLTEGVLRPITQLRTPNGKPDIEKQRKAMKAASEKAASAKRRVTSRDTQEAVDRINGIVNGKKDPHDSFTVGSQALYYASTAIHHLERIWKDDPKRHDAGMMVIKWCRANLITNKGEI